MSLNLQTGSECNPTNGLFPRFEQQPLFYLIQDHHIPHFNRLRFNWKSINVRESKAIQSSQIASTLSIDFFRFSSWLLCLTT